MESPLQPLVLTNQSNQIKFVRKLPVFFSLAVLILDNILGGGCFQFILIIIITKVDVQVDVDVFHAKILGIFGRPDENDDDHDDRPNFWPFWASSLLRVSRVQI